MKNSGYTICCRGKLFAMDEPCVMGILNITDDSFYDGGCYNILENALERAQKIYEEGAKIIDIGACSTRPGAKLVSQKDEILRLLPCIKAVRKEFPDMLISVDTVWAEVCKASVEAGADIINDISGGTFDKELFKTVGELKVPYVLMHTKGTPDKMQTNTQYEDIYMDICRYFAEKTAMLKDCGVHDIILDPGYGFAKTLEQNYLLIQRLQEFEIFDRPLLVGVSRKSMIYNLLGCSPKEALSGTIALNAWVLQTEGVKILRVHDVKAAVETIRIVQQIKNAKIS